VHGGNLRRSRTLAPGDAGDVSVSTTGAVSTFTADQTKQRTASEQAEGAARAARTSKFGTIAGLLDKLDAFVDKEGERAVSEHGADVVASAANRDQLIKDATVARDGIVEDLRVHVLGKHTDMTEKGVVLDGMKSVHAAKVTDHNAAVAAKGAAAANLAENQAYGASHVEQEEGACDANLARGEKAAAAQLAVDQQYLADAAEFVADLQRTVNEYQGASGRPTTMLLSISQRVQLHQFVSQYVSADPQYLEETRLALRGDQVGAINKAIAAVQRRLTEEQGDVAKAHAAAVEGLRDEHVACRTLVTTRVQTFLETSAAALALHTETERTTSGAREAAAKAEADAQAAFDTAITVHAAALATQKEDTAAANADFEAKQANANAEYVALEKGYSTKLTSAETYLAGEKKLINDIRVALSMHAVVTTKSFVQLAELSRRLTAHVSRRSREHYVDRLNGQGGVKASIENMLEEIEASLKLERSKSDAAQAEDTKTVNEWAATTVAAATTKRDGIIEKHRALVATATTEKNTADEALVVAKEEEAVAKGSMDAAGEEEKVALVQKVALGAEAQQVLDAAFATAAHMKATNMEIVDSKRDQGIHYLAQEGATVDRIEALLADLGKDYSFAVPSAAAAAAETPAAETFAAEAGAAAEAVAAPVAATAATTFLSVQELASSSKRLNAAQRQGLETLVGLLGAQGIRRLRFDAHAKETSFHGTDHTSSVASVKAVLDAVRDVLTASVQEVRGNHVKDVAIVDKEATDANAAATQAHAAEVARLQGIVDAAGIKLKKATTAHAGKVTAREATQATFNAKSAALESALSTQTTQLSYAASTFAADQKSVGTYQGARLAQIADEHSSDNTYITEEEAAIVEIRNALAEINFAVLLEAAQQYDAAQKSYITSSSADLKTRMLNLLGGIELNVQSELGRAGREFAADNRANAAEHEHANAMALQYKVKDLATLAQGAASARDEFKSSDEALDRANTAHSIASDKHQEDRDDLATAKQIEEVNERVFEQEYQRTKATATLVFDEQMEVLDNKKSRGDFYLQTNNAGLASVRTMLSRLDINTAATPAAPDTNMYAAREEHVTELADARFADRTNAERARIAVASKNQAVTAHSEVAGKHEGDFLVTSVDAAGVESRASTAQTADMAGAGERASYDARGNAVAAAKTPVFASLLEVAEAVTVSVSAKTTPEKVGTFIDALKGATEAEQGKSQTEYDGEVAKVTASRNSLMKKALDERDRLNKVDDERRAAAQAAHDSTLAVLTQATAAKDAASERHAVAADTLNDALLTQERMTPEVEKEYTTAVAANAETLRLANELVVDKKTKADVYLNAELKMLEKIRVLVNAKLATPQLLEMVARLVRSHVEQMGTRSHVGMGRNAIAQSEGAGGKKTRYTFDVASAQRMTDQAKGSFMTKGTVAEADYGAKTGSIDEMLDANSARIEAEIAKVATKHAADMTDITAERDAALKAALDKYTQTEQDLQDIVDAAQKAFDDAHAARAAQEKIRDTARLLAERRQNEYDAAKTLASNNESDETSIKTDTDSATKAHFSLWMGKYDAEEARARDIVKLERGILVEIRQLLTDNRAKAHAAPTQAMQDYCKAEYDAHAIEASKVGRARTACDRHKVEESSKAAREGAAYVWEEGPCAEFDARTEAMSASTEARDDCLAKAASALVKAEPAVDSVAAAEAAEAKAEAKVADMTVEAAVAPETQVVEAAAADSAGAGSQVEAPVAAPAAAPAAVAAAAVGAGNAGEGPSGPSEAAVAVGAGEGPSGPSGPSEAAVSDSETSKATALIELAVRETNRLARKYIKSGEWTEATSKDIDAALAALDELSARLELEDKKIVASAAADRATETALRDNKLKRAADRWDAAKARHDVLVAGAKDLRDATRDDHNAQEETFQKLLAVQQAKAELLQAAQHKYTTERKVAEDLKMEEDVAARDKFTIQKTRVDEIHRKDTAYLKSEKEAIKELKELVAQLNAKGL
jgi:hypothetical protein